MKSRRVCLVAALLAVAAGSSNAQTPNDLYLSGTCNNGSNTITLDVYDGGLRPDLVGYDVYRGAFGTCEPAVRLTDAPMSRELGQHFTRTLTDGGREPNRTYSYEVVGVDASRHAISLFQVYFYCSPISYVNCGAAPIAHGTLEDFGYTLRVEPCAGSCYNSGFGLLETFPASLRDYVGTGTPLLFYGRIGCGSVEGCLLFVETVVEQPCTVAIHPSTWSSVKSTYR